MNVNDSLYTEAVNRKNAIELILCRLRKDLSTAPEGTLRITRNRKSFQYYHRHSAQDPQGIYIKREDDPLAAALAQKDYDTKLLISLEKQLKAIDRFLKALTLAHRLMHMRTWPSPESSSSHRCLSATKIT